GTGWAPGARPVLLGRTLGRPVIQHRVEQFPTQLDLAGDGKERWFAEEHVQDETLVRLGGGFGERLAVREVHVVVADIHRGAGARGYETQSESLVRQPPTP